MAGKKTLETAFEQLETAISKLENEDMSLEQSFKLYTEGVKLVKYCNDEIDKVEKQMIELKAGDETDGICESNE